MTNRATLTKVAAAAGVSVPTASQVLRGTGRISQKTRERVLAASQDLGYVRDARAAAMRSGENHEIGFVINRLGNPFNAEVIGGVVDLLEGEGYLVSVLDARDEASRQDRQINAFVQHGRGGLLWVPALDTQRATYDRLAKRGMPVVTFLRRGHGGFDHVGIRNADATAVATAHLADLGHRRIAYLGGTDMTSVRAERIAGYEKAMGEHGLGSGVVWDSRDDKAAGLAAMDALRRAHPNVTAVVCNGDMVALGACLALQREGLVPGREMSVIGFDDVQDAAVATPPLTTMAVSPYRLGGKLARTLLDRIREPDAPATVTETAAGLVVRDTAGPIFAPDAM